MIKKLNLRMPHKLMKKKSNFNQLKLQKLKIRNHIK